MCASIETVSNCEQRAVIRFLRAENVAPAAIHRRLKNVYGNNAMSRVHVWEWCSRFKEGQTNVHDEERSGRPSIITEQLVESVKEKILGDHRVTISDLVNLFPDVSRGTIHDVLRGCLGYKKICARWFLKQLTSTHLKQRIGAALDFLSRYQLEGEDFLSRIITCDETWVYYSTPESKMDSMQWKHKNSPRVITFKRTLPVKKMIACVFWDSQGVIMVDFLQYSTTVNSEVYCNQLRKLRALIKDCR